MHPSEETERLSSEFPSLISPPSTIDWRAWIALGWAIGFGLIYTSSMIQSRGAAILAAIGRSLGG